MQALQQAWKNGGVGGVYAGYRAALVGDVIGAALGFTLFEQGKKVFEKAFNRKPDSVETGIVGMTSSACTLAVVMPFEVIQRRMQVRIIALIARLVDRESLLQSISVSTDGACTLLIC